MLNETHGDSTKQKKVRTLALTELKLWGEENKIDIAIDLLKTFEQMALELNPEGFYLTYSGGKDSDALLQVVIESGVKFVAHYNITGIDPKEAVIHIKKTRERLRGQGFSLVMDPPEKFRTGPFKGLSKNMWRLIIHKMMPPTRKCRFCCEHLKERGGRGYICLTGVRWEESTKRKSRRPLEIVTANKKDKKLFNDNDEGRMQFENCMQKGKRVLNPLIGWLTEDVWELLNSRKLPYCKKYDEGYTRIGCLGCPNSGSKGQERDFENYPYIKKLYILAFHLMLEYMWSRGIQTRWKTGEDVFEWWLYATEKEQEEFIDGQVEMLEWMGIVDDEDALV